MFLYVLAKYITIYVDIISPRFTPNTVLLRPPIIARKESKLSKYTTEVLFDAEFISFVKMLFQPRIN